MEEQINQVGERTMTKSTDDKLENWRLAGVRAKNANRILKEIKEGGPAFQKIRDGMTEARKRNLPSR